MIGDRAIIDALYRYGHFHGSVVVSALPRLKLTDREVVDALRSYQDFMIYTLEPLVQKHHGRALMADGLVGPSTRELFTIPRCELPDFGFGAAAEGTGSWPTPCQKTGVKFHVNKSGMPSGITSRWPEIQSQVVKAYGKVGLKLIEVARAEDANIRTFFGRFLGGTIGLAQFNGESCSDNVTCKLSSSYVGHNAGLLKHEWGHNCNLGHTRGGTMNPSILPEINADASWATNDPSYRTLVRFFGGSPIDGPPSPTPPPSNPESPFIRWLRYWFPSWFKS